MKFLILIAACCFAVCHASVELENKAEDAVNVNREKREVGSLSSNVIPQDVHTTRNKRATIYTNRKKRQTEALSADDQCIRQFGAGSYFCRATYDQPLTDYSVMCRTGLCSNNAAFPACVNVTFDEMTTCGNQKWCIAGQCVFDEDAPVTSSDLCPQGDSPTVTCTIYTPEQCEGFRVNGIQAVLLRCCDHCKEETATTTTTTTPTTPTTTTSTTTPTTTTSTTTPTTTTSTTTPTTTTSTTTPTTTTSTTTPTTTTSTTTPTTNTSTTTPTTTTTTPTTTTSTTTSTRTTTQKCNLFRYLKGKCSNISTNQLNCLRRFCRSCRKCRYLYNRKCRSCMKRNKRKLCQLLWKFEKQ
ncbi:integumentary mucin C.1 [Patella vulgata]|uniref:integumentary mucin C.1 n=1 Tax=Patella vulgata TaxID=6465 RepID=UPI0024A917A0|nr:integumentary mucin C.1 [Patella vulgata]